MSTISTRQTLLDQLAALRLPAFRQALETQFASPLYDELSFEERLALLVEQEHLQRQDQPPTPPSSSSSLPPDRNNPGH